MSHIRETRVPLAEWEAEHGPLDTVEVRRLAYQSSVGSLVRAQLAALADGYVLEFDVVEGDADADQ